MKVVALVPMKLNNQRLPQKNIKSFTNGEPLCTYILKTLTKCRIIDEVYVYCSSKAIIEYLPSGVQYLERNKKFDTNATKMNEILEAFANEVQADIYVLAHATAPFLRIETIEKGIQAIQGGEYDSAFTVKCLQDFLWKDGRPINYRLDNIPRTQDLETLYVESSGVYIYRKEVIVELGRRIGNTPFMLTVSEIEGIDIDEMEDFIMADAVFNYYKRMFGGGKID